MLTLIAFICAIKRNAPFEQKLSV